jgi:perosamine synthetase
MTDVQGAVGVVQLKKLDTLNQKRIENARIITAGLQDIPGISVPAVKPGRKHVFHLYPIQIDQKKFGRSKDDFIYAMLHERGVKVGTHYTPLHYTTAFQNRGFHKSQFPVAESVADRLVTLPINPRQTPEALDYLIASVRAMYRG